MVNITSRTSLRCAIAWAGASSVHSARLLACPGKVRTCAGMLSSPLTGGRYENHSGQVLFDSVAGSRSLGPATSEPTAPGTFNQDEGRAARDRHARARS